MSARRVTNGESVAKSQSHDKGFSPSFVSSFSFSVVGFRFFFVFCGVGLGEEGKKGDRGVNGEEMKVVAAGASGAMRGAHLSHSRGSSLDGGIAGWVEVLGHVCASSRDESGERAALSEKKKVAAAGESDGSFVSRRLLTWHSCPGFFFPSRTFNLSARSELTPALLSGAWKKARRRAFSSSSSSTSSPSKLCVRKSVQRADIPHRYQRRPHPLRRTNLFPFFLFSFVPLPVFRKRERKNADFSAFFCDYVRALRTTGPGRDRDVHGCRDTTSFFADGAAACVLSRRVSEWQATGGFDFILRRLQ